MRITNKKIKKKEATWIEETTSVMSGATNPITKEKISTDLSKDFYSLFGTLSPREIIKKYSEIDNEVTDAYVKQKVNDYVKVRNHYTDAKDFMHEFSVSNVYNYLQGLQDPAEALRLLLKMFTPQDKTKEPPPPPDGSQEQQEGQEGGDNQQEGDEQPGVGNQKEGDEEEQPGEDNEISDNPPTSPLDMNKFKKSMPILEKLLNNDIMNDDVQRELLEQRAGIGHNELSTFEGVADNLKKITNELVDWELDIFEVSRKVDSLNAYSRDEELSDVRHPEKDFRITNIKSMTDLPRVIPHQHLYPEEMFDKMLMDKDLQMKQYQNRRKKKQILYMLIDASGSMDTRRIKVATGIAIAYIKKAISEGSIYFFRHFDEGVFDLHKVTNKKEAKKRIDYLLRNPKSGGGTSIDTAIKQAVKDINDPKMFNQSKKEIHGLYERADILVITDGEDNVSIEKEWLKKNKVVLHSFCIEHNNPQLKDISDNYQFLNRDDINKLMSKTN